MANFSGMDAGEVTNLAHHLSGQAANLESSIAALDGIVSQIGMSWSGHDALEFAGWWHQKHRPALIKAQQDLAGLAQSALNNVHQQQGASSVAGSVIAAAATAGVGIGGAAASGGSSGTFPLGSPPNWNQVSASGYQQWYGPDGQGPKQYGYASTIDYNGRTVNESTQCTGWVAYRCHQTGMPMPQFDPNSAAILPHNGYHQVGAQQVTPGTLVTTSDNSHTLFVEKVLPPVDGQPRLMVSEMNYTGNGNGGSANYSPDSILTYHPGSASEPAYWTDSVFGNGKDQPKFNYDFYKA